MSNRLAISAALSVLMMAGMVLFDTRPANEPFGTSAASTSFEVTAVTPQASTALFGTSR
ncbi:MAG: hypothetical protein ABIT04_07840 [Novosphingobium sp.]